MKTAMKALLLTAAVATPAAAASAGATSEGIGVLAIVFLAFGAAILVFQFVPALALFCTMIYGLFTAARRTSTSANGEKTHAPS